MLSREQILRYRAMSPEDRYAEFLAIAAWAWRALDADGPEIAARRWERIQRDHAESSRRLVEAFRQLP